MRHFQGLFEQRVGRPLANINVALMRGYIRSIQLRGVDMVHTARPFSVYRRVFYRGHSANDVLASLKDKRVVDVGCGYTPYAADSMFRACSDEGIDFYGVDPVIASDPYLGWREQLVARVTGGRGMFSKNAPGLVRALPARAENLPFDDESVDEILSGYLLFVWIDDEQLLADILHEFLRVLKPGGVVKLYPLYEWRWMRFTNNKLLQVLGEFSITQRYISGYTDWRVPHSLLTELVKT